MSLDPALSRAGRFDVHVPFSTASPVQARDLFLHFYKPSQSSGPLASGEKTTATAPFADSSAVNLTRAFPTGSYTEVGGKDGATVSMAALQCYLLGYKEDAIAAFVNAGEWARSLAPKDPSALLNEENDEKTEP